MPNRGPRSSEIKTQDVEEQLREKQLIPYRVAVFRGVVVAILMLLVQSLIAGLFYLLLSNLLVFGILFTLLSFEVAMLFIASGIAIWFDPSPSWGQFKSNLLNRPYIQISVQEATRTGVSRSVSAITLLFLIDLLSPILS